uniref:Glycoside hydrolase family 5 domain-containing protein n=1 Tax=Acrobeloides nanus TaxID=290746 RepID=A0A914CZB1_9BILA
MSLFWSTSSDSRYYNQETLTHLKAQWNSNIVRIPMAVENGGYVNNSQVEYGKVKAVIEGAISVGMYVIVDWHTERADLYVDEATKFFSNISKTYGSNPHIIYEIWNEPNRFVNWTMIKSYAQQVIPAIRANDPNNIIIVGTPIFSQLVNEAADDPLSFPNIAYTLHYYAGSHKQELRDIATYAINKSLPIFVTEYGVVNYTENGPIYPYESKIWWNFLDENKISYVNWAVSNNDPTWNPFNTGAGAFVENTTPEQVGYPSRWSISGKFVNAKYQNYDQGFKGYPTYAYNNSCAVLNQNSGSWTNQDCGAVLTDSTCYICGLGL